MILGVAAKDTAITPLYKRKKENGDERGAKRAKIGNGSAIETSNGESTKSVSDDKKPSGYTFLTAEKTRAIICKAVASNSNEEGRESSYIHDYLRIPDYIQTMVVPTFAFVTEVDDGAKNGKKYVSKQSQLSEQSDPKERQQHQGKKKEVIPSGTVNSAAIDTPHGWQNITPEQYAGVVESLGLGQESVDSVGVVGLFDYLDLTNHASSLFEEDGVAEATRKQALKKITTSFQKCTSWATRMQRTMSDTSNCKELPMWVPVNIFSSFLPEHVLSKCFSANHNSDRDGKQNALITSSHVAIVGWESFPSHIQYKQKRHVLHKLMQSIQSMPTPESPKQFLVLAVNDVASILNAAREGVSIIGTDLAREMSCKGAALVLDFYMPESQDALEKDESIKKKNAVRARIDLNDKKYAKDNEPLMQGCTCLTCRPRKACNRPIGYQHFQNESNQCNAAGFPSFSRAYIHHLIQAKEMLAGTLLFVHNLHQLVLLFRGLSNAAVENRSDVHGASRLHSFCHWVERQL